ncbi:hypothetical protein FA09DRAFT_168849 [Tilletiopsis washingtonensis]|uniref:Uncharacterized protein n=1 Tax=Tilletiopsis washingtonensis TaxID=58919 RepID=A0A316YZB1_9BASI|nr:hypothetical protein FA09DRAFT_168849 [Tilletiopsis washingtonensis]PWN94790.1 hypothetical protein FA09DRAFT_168849 [Tilletiopsis washingtonensis]
MRRSHAAELGGPATSLKASQPLSRAQARRVASGAIRRSVGSGIRACAAGEEQAEPSAIRLRRAHLRCSLRGAAAPTERRCERPHGSSHAASQISQLEGPRDGASRDTPDPAPPTACLARCAAPHAQRRALRAAEKRDAGVIAPQALGTSPAVLLSRLHAAIANLRLTDSPLPGLPSARKARARSRSGCRLRDLERRIGWYTLRCRSNPRPSVCCRRTSTSAAGGRRLGLQDRRRRNSERQNDGPRRHVRRLLS